MVGGEAAGVDIAVAAIEHGFENLGPDRAAGRDAILFGHVVKAQRADQRAINIDAEAVAVFRVVIIVAGDFLRVHRDEVFAAIRFIAQAVDRIELLVDRDPAIFHPVEQINQGYGKPRRARLCLGRRTHYQ
ncbi:hypothetical protein D9M68_918460 [compost metagenome]